MKKDIFRLLWMLPFIFTTLGFQTEPPAERPKVETYITKYRYLASLNQQTGIPVPIILAVAGLESDWGTSELAQYSNNQVGRLGGPQPLQYTYQWENENWIEIMDCFRKYPLIRDSYFDFGISCSSRSNYFYLFRNSQDNLEAWAYGLWYSNYATDPEYSERSSASSRRSTEYSLSPGQNSLKDTASA